MKALLYVFVAAAGALTSIEAGANAKLTKVLGAPWWGGVVFSAVSLVLLAVGAAAFGKPIPAMDQLRSVPWWGWTGGVFGAIYVMSMAVGPGQLGSGLFTGLTVTAAVLCSIALDNFGWVGFEQHTAGIGRLIGAALMVAGLICVAVF